MKLGTKHSEETKQIISLNTKLAMKDPVVREKYLRVCFQKGHSTWNKGLSVHLSPESEFKIGEMVGSEHYSWKGGIQKPINDCVHLWNGVNQRIRRPKKVVQDFGVEIPQGWVVYHINGEKTDDRIENLMVIPRSLLIKLNQNKRKIKSGV